MKAEACVQVKYLNLMFTIIEKIKKHSRTFLLEMNTSILILTLDPYVVV